jgi:predicted nucleic acid-binding protein
MPSHVMLDTSVLIDHFRARNKESTFYTKIIQQCDIRLISVVAKLEVLYGTRPLNPVGNPEPETFRTHRRFETF